MKSKFCPWDFEVRAFFGLKVGEGGPSGKRLVIWGRVERACLCRFWGALVEAQSESLLNVGRRLLGDREDEERDGRSRAETMLF